MQSLVDQIKEKLYTESAGLVGCRRRNAYDVEAGSTPTWALVRGNALLALVGTKHGIHTPVGYHEFFMLKDHWLLFFRAGQWRDYWMDDFKDLWALVAAYDPSLDLSSSVVVLVEDQSQLTARAIEVKSLIPDPKRRAGAVISGALADPPDRITKADARAHKVCRFCPHRAKCNAQDILDNATNDWSESYRKELA